MTLPTPVFSNQIAPYPTANGVPGITTFTALEPGMYSSDDKEFSMNGMGGGDRIVPDPKR